MKMGVKKHDLLISRVAREGDTVVVCAECAISCSAIESLAVAIIGNRVCEVCGRTIHCVTDTYEVFRRRDVE